ncbi:hypothetical protein FKM82_029451 [Ascaphus truei]
MSDELRCLQIINRMEDVSDPVEFDLDGLILNEACQKLASNIKSYITQVTESVIQRTATRGESGVEEACLVDGYAKINENPTMYNRV